jgi:transcriptional regulator with XRE-family HTH domain
MQQVFVVRSGADLGAAVRQSRLALGMTQEQVARETNLERTYLARLEGGATVALLDRALRLLRFLGAEVTVTIPPPNAALSEDRPSSRG